MAAVHRMMDLAIGGLSDLANADVVMAKPVDVKGKQVIPVLALNVGFGGGGGEAEGEGSGHGHGAKKHGGKGKGKGAGSGAAGGARLIPIALVVRDAAGVRVLRVPKPKKGIEKFIDMIPGLVEKIQKLENK